MKRSFLFVVGNVSRPGKKYVVIVISSVIHTRSESLKAITGNQRGSVMCLIVTVNRNSMSVSL